MNSPADDPPAPNTDRLLAGGFTQAGVWRLDPATGSIRFEGTELPSAPGVYAYAVGGIVHYVGSAQRGLRGRLRHYEIAKTLRTAHRIRQEILALLAAGTQVEVFTMVPPPITLPGGLPFVIRSWRPIWNRRGLGGAL